MFTQFLHDVCFYILNTLVPRLLYLFNVAQTEGEPGKTYHMRDIRWKQLPYTA